MMEKFDNRQDRRRSTLESIFQIRKGIDHFEATWFAAENLWHVDTSKSLTATKLEKLHLQGFDLVVTAGLEEQTPRGPGIRVVLKDK